MEEEGTKEGGEKLRGAQMADKAGWIKKSSGGLLGLWKDRYLLLCKAQLLVYENEDEQKCIETVELGSYEKCQDLRALLKRKHRFILLRSPGNKVHDIKFQAQNGEEKESWIKALNEGINKGKNKAFDEVKVDKSCALEHVTRDRVRGGQRRRPPTRIHLKEVASAASDGLLRLDLDVPDSGPPSFISSNNISDSPPREKPRPPMPPTKPSQDPEKPNLEDIAEKPEADESPPATAPDNSPDHPEDQSVAETSEEDLETSALPGGSKENLTEGNKSGEKALELPPKVQPDKLKVSWENPSPEPPTPVGKESDQSTSSETASREGGKPPAPPPKILSEKLKASMRQTTSQDQCQDSQASKSPDPDPGCSQVSVNGVTDSDNGIEPIAESSLQRATEDSSDQKTPLKEGDKGQLASLEPSPASLEDEGAEEGSGATLPDGPPVLSPLQPRCASLGNLLSESDKGQRMPLDRHQLVKIEKKVTSEREKTEQLLNQVLGRELEHNQEGNGPPANAETLLNQAVEQLRQATQVLQEIKVLGELNKEPPTTLIEKQKEKQKDLVTLYRRSAP
ncbi:pleckstrin homology domain-containing family O member 2 isoform X2 [Dromiciops gliroides]|uniref:pleckstrin homology domain-containing family O member 2 isoform X2 n=1 Tax=Dromiciops gliroides TaxID=33562 RepID=UPI001CC3D09E|nr:pleckstrin homology domain-containing family O member 2 isoform X2 [Dromiciops gliroides]